VLPVAVTADPPCPSFSAAFAISAVAFCAALPTASFLRSEVRRTLAAVFVSSFSEISHES
jgi:hypothetical protein